MRKPPHEQQATRAVSSTISYIAASKQVGMATPPSAGHTLAIQLPPPAEQQLCV